MMKQGECNAIPFFLFSPTDCQFSERCDWDMKNENVAV